MDELISPANLELIGDYHDDDVDGDDHDGDVDGDDHDDDVDGDDHDDDDDGVGKQRVIMLMMTSRQLVRMRGSPPRSGLFRSLLPLKIQIRRWKLQQPPGDRTH